VTHTDHDPLTCERCDPRPWTWTEVTTGGRTRRWTGWPALVIVFGPPVVMAFLLGVLVGVILVAVVAP
jgi:hypothetical protein